MPATPDRRLFLTKRDVLNAHAEFGRMDWHMVKEAMGPNWPPEWEAMGPGDGIFEPDEDRKDKARAPCTHAMNMVTSFR